MYMVAPEVEDNSGRVRRKAICKRGKRVEEEVGSLLWLRRGTEERVEADLRPPAHSCGDTELIDNSLSDLCRPPTTVLLISFADYSPFDLCRQTMLKDPVLAPALAIYPIRSLCSSTWHRSLSFCGCGRADSFSGAENGSTVFPASINDEEKSSLGSNGFEFVGIRPDGELDLILGGFVQPHHWYRAVPSHGTEQGIMWHIFIELQTAFSIHTE
ncbi:hypothetical protein M5K25_026114 [Dendrobium thyrsiflorum]|uniref:Uncharacterized protein n=1 Tax=Dendrobium thyrsiflorum TaxID=117978 RepID=A0ABD0TWL0_DENTH